MKVAAEALSPPPPSGSVSMITDVPTLNFTLHAPPSNDVAEVEDDMDSLFPHTPRHDGSWFEAEPSAELIEQCLRPGHCCIPEGEVCNWLHRHLVQLGHAANESGEIIMAQTWFECAYAVEANCVDLISAANMRLKLGQWATAEHIYQEILRMELSATQREVSGNTPPALAVATR